MTGLVLKLHSCSWHSDNSRRNQRPTQRRPEVPLLAYRWLEPTVFPCLLGGDQASVVLSGPPNSSSASSATPWKNHEHIPSHACPLCNIARKNSWQNGFQWLRLYNAYTVYTKTSSSCRIHQMCSGGPCLRILLYCTTYCKVHHFLLCMAVE